MATSIFVSPFLTQTSTALSPRSADGSSLGTTALPWSDLFLASGGVINFNNGNVTLTHSANRLTLDSLFNITESQGLDTPVVTLTNNGNADFMQAFHVLAPNIAGSRHVTGYSVGQAFSARNSAYLGFFFSSSGSTSNYGTLGLHSVDDVLVWTGSGNVGIGTTTPGSKLEVAGTIRADTSVLSPVVGTVSGNLVFGAGGNGFLNLDTSGVLNFINGTATSITNGAALGIDATNIAIHTTGGGGSYGSGTKVVFLANATGVPSTNPTGGGILYSEAGALKWRGSGGTVTTLGPA